MSYKGKVHTNKDVEARVWDKYLREAEQFLEHGTPKGPNAKPINHINHIGANIVKNRAVKVAAAGIVLNAEKNKKGLGLKGNQATHAERLLEAL